jgi:hypothetical protein
MARLLSITTKLAVSMAILSVILFIWFLLTHE